MAGHDINYIALSGVLSLLGGKPHAPPQPPINILGDFAGGSLVCLLGILVAIIERGVSGKGQVVEADMVTGARYITTFCLLAAGLEHPLWGAPIGDGTNEKRGSGMLDGGAPWYGVYQTKDQQWMSVGAIEPQFYDEFLSILAKHSLGISGAPSKKSQHDRQQWPAQRDYLSRIFATKTRDEWTAIFVGTEACCVPVLTPGEAATQAVEPRMPAEAAEAGAPPIVPQPAPRLSRTPARAPTGSATYAPRDEDPGAELLLTPGEHTNEVLSDWLCMSSREIGEMYKAGAIGGPDAPEDDEPRSKL